MTDKEKDMANDNPLTEQEEKALYRLLAYKMWDEWTEEFKAMTPEEKAEQEEHVKYFMEQTGAERKSPACFMYFGFLAGVAKGIEFVEKLDKQTESPASVAAQAGQAITDH